MENDQGGILSEENHTKTSETDDLQCPYCFKKLSTKQNLKDHINIHTGEMPYVCTEPGCSMRFRQTSQLSAHKKKHIPSKRVVRNEEIEVVKVRDI